MPRSNSRSTRSTVPQYRNNSRDEATFDADDVEDAASDEAFFEKFRFESRYDTTPKRVVAEGKSGRQDVESESAAPDATGVDAPGSNVEGTYSSYDVATHGPDPVPEWVVTSYSAVDTPLGILKTGKEADVHLLDRTLPGAQSSLLAVKTYRSAEHRMFHRDSAYQEGRRTRRSREGRAMAARTAFGRELLAGKWAAAEFTALSTLWAAGASVPYPVQLIGSEVMMEFVGDAEGVAASRLAAASPPPDAGPDAYFGMLWDDLVVSLELLASLGYTHGDLSPYNILVSGDRCVLIDLPQVVDVIANPQGAQFLARDAQNVADFFRRRGVDRADGDILTARLADHAGL